MNNDLLVIVNSSKSWGGLEINTVKIAKWLESYMEVLLVCLKDSPIEENAKKYDLKIEYTEKPGKFLPLKLSWKLHKILKAKNCKKIFFTDNKDMSYCNWAKIFTSGCKVYYQQHMQIGINKKDIIHTLRYKMLDAWISPLSWLAEEVKEKTKMPHSKIFCIPLGIETDHLLSQSVNQDEARNFWGIKTDYPLVGIIGRLDIQKNQHLLIEAVKILKDQNIKISLLIVGEPTRETEHLNYTEKLHNMVDEFNIKDQVYFHPFTNRIAAFYSSLDIFVMATNKETYGMVTLEAMLFNAPVIASNTGGSPEILGYGKYGMLFESGNANDLADKIKYILENKEVTVKKAEAAHKFVVENFDYKTECKQIVELIKNS